MQLLDKRISDRVKLTPKDWFNSVNAKPIDKDRSVLNDALGRIILLTEFHNSWTRKGMFIKNVPWSEYAFLEREMLEKDGGLIFEVSPLNLAHDSLTKQDDSSYILRLTHGGGSYTEDRLNSLGKPNSKFDEYFEMINRAYTLPEGMSIYS